MEVREARGRQTWEGEAEAIEPAGKAAGADGPAALGPEESS